MRNLKTTGNARKANAGKTQRATAKIDRRLRPNLPKAAINRMNTLEKMGMSISLIVKNLQQKWSSVNYYDVWKILGNPGSQKMNHA